MSRYFCIVIITNLLDLSQILPPIEADIDKERERIPRNEGRAKTAQVYKFSFCILVLHICHCRMS